MPRTLEKQEIITEMLEILKPIKKSFQYFIESVKIIKFEKQINNIHLIKYIYITETYFTHTI